MKEITHIDSNVTSTVSTITSATGTTQATATPVITDNAVIASADNQTTTGPFSGVCLPPTTIGRIVSLFNTSAYTVNVYPCLAVPGFTGTCRGTTVTVASTDALQPNMILSGSGVVAGTTIIRILSETTFAVNISQFFISVPLEVTNAGQSKINNGVVNTGTFHLTPTTSVTVIATAMTDWVTSGAAIISNTATIGLGSGTGTSPYLVILESTKGNVFRVGQGLSTLLIAHVFHGTTDATDSLQASQFSWRRVSPDATADSAWNAAHATGYKQVLVSVDDMSANATFFCDIYSLS